MKTHLDSLMQQKGLDALLVAGPAQHNPAMYYFTGGAHLTHADLLKPRGSDPVLFFRPMERDEAANTGIKAGKDYPLVKFLKQASDDIVQANVLRYKQILTDMGLTTGRLAVYGLLDAGAAYAIFSALEAAMPGLTLVGEMDDSLLLQARSTKDDAEVARIRKMGEITTSVVGRVADFLTSHKVKDGILLQVDGQPLRIADVKQRVNLWLAEMGAENPEGTIFAIGRDAGIPHSTGNPSDVISLGQTIVFDIFPCEAGGGYFYDFTRTWCLGYATDAVQAIYDDVLAVYNQIMAELKAGKPCPEYQRRTCALFEARGHPTIESNPATLEGYVHSLGHGLGLNVHERPWFGRNASDADLLAPGSVVTIEPGLYYPERGMGVRLENTVYVRADGKMEVLAPYPMDLVLPMKES